MKTCARCGTSKEFEEFHVSRNPHQLDGRQSWCKECSRAHNREYHQRKAEEISQRKRDWYWSNLEHARTKARERSKTPKAMEMSRERCRRRQALISNAAEVERVSLSYIKERDGMRCHICGRKVHERDVSFDHLIPLSKGGPHTHANIRVAHLSCNFRRGPGRIPAQLLLVP